MKTSLRALLTISLALVVLLGLSGCGNSGSSTWSANSFAYIQYENSGDASTSHTHANLHKSHKSSQTVSVHKAGKRSAKANIDLETGSADIYVYNTSTSTNTELASGYNLYSAQLSQDGTKLLAGGWDSNGYAQIYIADAKFDTVTQLTTDENDHWDPTLSADGSTVAYDVEGALYTISSSGGTPTAYTGAISALWAWAPAFTPDGKSLVFCGEYYNETAGYYADLIFSVNLSTAALTQLSANNTTSGSVYTYDGFPVVSTDGKTVAFSREVYNESKGTETENIATIKISGETTANPATVLTTDGEAWQPQYLGSKILYLDWSDSTTDNAYNIYEMNADGSSVTRLTNTTLNDVFDGDD
jgi:Tol biopolymer transport system component